MDLSIFLAKVIGLYMLIVGIIILKKPGLRGAINELSRENDLRFILGLFTLILGILMVVSHNIWDGPAYVIIITLISWIVFLKGICVTWLSEETYRKLTSALNTPSMLTVSGVLYLIVGLYLAYVGFFV